jgi:hypothetical protein
LLLLIEQLPPDSRTKTAQRDRLDPFELARMAEHQADARAGWGPWGPLHELIAQVGERVDYLAYVTARAGGGKDAKEPARWRRPGVLGAVDLALVEQAISAPVVNQLETERAEREARRRAAQGRP